MERPTQKFSVDQTVRRSDSPDIVGVIRGMRWNPQLGEWVYTVQFGAGRRSIPEDALEALPDIVDPWHDVVSQKFGSARSFSMLLTYERLAKPPTRIASSFASAKAAFYPFQFKPLLKFLENPKQRLLIADDVGLGKTIEAGYILRELRARHHIERVLIVVPARLRSKWKDEMLRRFDETFDLVKPVDIKRFVQSTQRSEEPGPFFWITSLESIRTKSMIDLFSGGTVPIDLVIVDEGHRMRNPATLQHRMGRALSSCADAMLLLTATPIQTQREDLFHLLRTLDDEMYTDRDVFLEQLDSQRLVMRALQAIRARPPAEAEAFECLTSFVSDPVSGDLAETSLFQSVLERITRCGALSRSELVDLQRDVTELSFTSGVISRTRKADVISNRPQRVAQTHKVRFSAEEQSFYDNIASLFRQSSPALEDWGWSMGLLMAYRYTASCIPAALEYFHERLGRLDQLAADVAGETEDESGWSNPSDELRARKAARENPFLDRSVLESVVFDGLTLPRRDTKLEKLLEAVNAIWQMDDEQKRSRRKIVVFSFFKRTLRYLERALKAGGVVCRRIDGDVPIIEREARIEEFASIDDVRVLLSSEVGSEGLDLQVASVVVNYDLPWNPMVLEQRIGRLDRIGQRSERINILNMSVKGTIEERILLRLYERIGIFEDTIGEIEPILGRKIEELAFDALSGRLNDSELDRRALETADAAAREISEANRLGGEADALIAADQAFLDEVEGLIGKRKLPNSREIFRFFKIFTAGRYPGSRLSDRCADGVGRLHLSPQLASDLVNELAQSSDAIRIASWIQRGPFLATFDAHAILENARAELIHPQHPLIRFALARLKKDIGDASRSFALRLPSKVHKGGYLVFALCMFEYFGGRPRCEMVPFFFDMDGGIVLDQDLSDDLAAEMLDSAEELDPPPTLPENDLVHARDALGAAIEELRSSLSERERDLNEARVARRRATLEGSLRAKVDSAERRLQTLRRGSAQDLAVRLAQARVDKARTHLAAFQQKVSEQSEYRIEIDEIAVGVLNISKEPSREEDRP